MITGPKKSYVDLLDETLLANQKKEQEGKGYYPLRPSASGYCSRKLAYELAAFEGKGEKIHEDRKPNVIRLLGLGHQIEYGALKELALIPGMSIKFKQQVVSMFKLPSGRIIEGSTDAVMWSEESRGLLDVKSVGNRWSAGFQSRWDEMMHHYDTLTTMVKFGHNSWWVEDPIAFFEEVGEDSLVANITQVNLYACSPFMQERGIDHGSIFRYEKASSQISEVRFKPSMELFNRVKRRFGDIEKAVAKGDPELVKRDFGLGSQACAYCPYRSKCHPSANATKEHYKTMPKKNWAERLENLEGAPLLEKLFNDYLTQEKVVKDHEITKAAILKELADHEIRKVKLQDGQVFEVKTLQSPKPHNQLRRGKE